MKFFIPFLLGASFFLHAVATCSEEQLEGSFNKRHITYLVQSKEISSAIDLYTQYKNSLNRHDFEVLQHIATILLEEGAHSQDAEKQLLSLYGSGMGGALSSSDVLEAAISSRHPETQVAAIHLIGQAQEDRGAHLLNRAMSSDFFLVRMEAAYQLALRKASSATGQIESLMYKLPHEMHFFFPQFFALIGTSDAISVLKHLMSDKSLSVRIESILSAARHGRDDLLPQIRARATHLNAAEQEACVAALGALKDSRSLSSVKKWTKSPAQNVQLACLTTLHLLGDPKAYQEIFSLAKDKKDIFAITALGELEGSEEILAHLLTEENFQVRFNAALSLLKRRDGRCMQTLLQVLVRDTRDFGLQPVFSPGRSQMAWKVVPSIHQLGEDFQALSLSAREHMLVHCLELSEKEFLHVANAVFESGQLELVPMLVNLLENLNTPEAMRLLETKSQTAGSPLTRSYCNLALFRQHYGGQHEESLLKWISMQQHTQLIRFRPLIPLNLRLPDTPFELTPEESSRLLIEAYQALADKHDDKSIDALLQAIKNGHSMNRYVLAGLLLRAIQ